MLLQEGAAAGPARRGGVSPRTVQVLGELLITAGVVLLLFVAWQLWWTNVAVGCQQSAIINDFAQELGPSRSVPPAGAQPSTTVRRGGRGARHGGTIGIMYIPRFGADYTRPIVQGTTPDVLDTLGLGHYQRHGHAGRGGQLRGGRPPADPWGGPGQYPHPGPRRQDLRPDQGRLLRLRVPEQPDCDSARTDVLLPVPTQPAAPPTERYLTMTSCNPRFGAQERIIAYALLDNWQPASAGPPAEIAAQVAKAPRGRAEPCTDGFSAICRGRCGSGSSPRWCSAGVLVLMVQFLFPWMSQFTQFTDSTIGSARQP